MKRSMIAIFWWFILLVLSGAAFGGAMQIVFGEPMIRWSLGFILAITGIILFVGSFGALVVALEEDDE